MITELFRTRMNTPRQETTITISDAIKGEKLKIAAINRKIDQTKQAMVAMQNELSLLKQKLAVAKAQAAKKAAAQAQAQTPAPQAPKTTAPAESVTMSLLLKLFGVKA